MTSKEISPKQNNTNHKSFFSAVAKVDFTIYNLLKNVLKHLPTNDVR